MAASCSKLCFQPHSFDVERRVHFSFRIGCLLRSLTCDSHFGPNASHLEVISSIDLLVALSLGRIDSCRFSYYVIFFETAAFLLQLSLFRLPVFAFLFLSRISDLKQKGPKFYSNASATTRHLLHCFR
jgi:hypothetical protein